MRPAMNGSNEEVFVTIDGQSGHALQSDDEICITRADRPLRRGERRPGRISMCEAEAEME